MPAIQFSLNRMSAPQIPFDAFCRLATEVGVDTIEIRNDLSGVELVDGTPAQVVAATAQRHSLSIATINALQKFEQWNGERESEARYLIDYARAAGVRALVLCPTNSRADSRDAATRHHNLVDALMALKPLLTAAGLIGFLEPLGFEQCAMRNKSQAVRAIDEVNGRACFRLVHDTFHHHLAGEGLFFPDYTGLVHISGVEEPTLSSDRMRDGHRVLVGQADRLGNCVQLRTLYGLGYQGVISFEPFAESIANAADIATSLKQSMAFIRSQLA